MRTISHFIDGVSVSAGPGGRRQDVFDPNIGRPQASVELGDSATLERAVASAKAAQPAWAATNPQRRARVMFEFKRLIEAYMDELAHLLASEHGKVISDAKGDIQRGLDVVEFVCGVPHLMKGEYTEGAGPGIDVYSLRQPIGVAAGITPFNKLRDEMREFIVDLQRRVGITTLYVTHDQAEAMTMSDRIAVMFKGKVAQYGAPRDICERPKGMAVATFIGQAIS